MSKNYYTILGVNETAPASEIKKAYRKLAMQYHPDRNPGNKAAEEKFKEISEAYDVVGDEQKRQKYDQMRKYGFNSGNGQGFNGFDFGNFRQSGRSTGTGGFTFEGFSGFEDILNEFFGGGFRTTSTRRRPQQNTQSVNAEISIPFELAINGGKTPVTLQTDGICSSCQGGGAKPGSQVQTCPVCHGRGVQNVGGALGFSQPCSKCGGKGQIIQNPCDRCHGTGIAKVQKTFVINIKPGIREGEKIRLKGQGRPALRNSPASDLIIGIRVQSHRFFNRKGDDIHCAIDLSLDQAVNGTSVRVKTVDGKKVNLKIPSKTADGKVFRIPNMGIQNGSRRGDQFVKVRVKMPKNPTEAEKEMMNSLV